MRLVCPNCDAQYEVDDAVIPDTGRDVQCSNCGHTWFQPPASQVVSEPEPQPELQRPEPEPRPEPESEPVQAAPESDQTDVEDAADKTPHIDLAETLDEADAAEAAEPERQDLDEAVLSILREEAEFETGARRAERGEGLETQPELGLAGAAAGGGLQERVARLRGIAPESGTVAASSRRDLLPDIEEINSTLRATSDRHGEAGAQGGDLIVENEELPRRRGSFGMGFGVVILIAALVVAVYSFAPSIVAAVPALEPVMSAYVGALDAGRQMLNGAIMSATEWLTGLISGA